MLTVHIVFTETRPVLAKVTQLNKHSNRLDNEDFYEKILDAITEKCLNVNEYLNPSRLSFQPNMNGVSKC